MAEFRVPTTAPITDDLGDIRGIVDHFSVVMDQTRVKTQRWLEIGGSFEDRQYGNVRWTSRIPLAEGLTLVREPVEGQ